MGISLEASLIYGANYVELANLKNLNELLDDGSLDYASPYYDSDKCHWIVGIGLSTHFDDESEMLRGIREARSAFEKVTNGMPGRIIVSPHVT